MKKIIFLPILLMMPLVACGEGDEAPETPTNWSVDIKAEMNDNIGEVLPYVSFGEGFYHSWTASSSVYSIGDTSSVNVLSGYGAKLEAKGWVEYNSKDEITYKKQNDKGYLTLKATYSSGNKITVTVKDSEDIDPVGEEWSAAIKADMNQYLGEVLPYAALDKSTMGYELYYEFTEEIDGYVGYNWWMWDDSETNVLEDYGEKLLEAGFTYDTDTYGDPFYYKVKTNGDELDIYFDWYPSEVIGGETIPAGNQIDCYFYRGEGGVDPTPISGSAEIVIGSIPGLVSGKEFGTKTISPGVTIATDKGTNSSNLAPKYYVNTDGTIKDLRCYANNTVTISAEEITKIEFTYSSKDNQQFKPSTGSISNDLKTWTGSASTITFTLGNSGQLRITKIVVYGEFAGGDTPIDTYTPYSVCRDIDYWAFEDAEDSDIIGPDSGGMYYGYYTIFFEDLNNTEEDIIAAIETCIYDESFPSYLSLDPYMDEVGYSNGTGYVYLVTDDGSVAVYMESNYINEDEYIGVSVSFEAAPYDYYDE